MIEWVSRRRLHDRSIIRLDFLKCVLEDWSKTLGVPDLRKDKNHNLVGGAGLDPTEESVGQLFDPISMIMAQFVKALPLGSKFVVSGLIT